MTYMYHSYHLEESGLTTYDRIEVVVYRDGAARCVCQVERRSGEGRQCRAQPAPAEEA